MLSFVVFADVDLEAVGRGAGLAATGLTEVTRFVVRDLGDV